MCATSASTWVLCDMTWVHTNIVLLCIHVCHEFDSYVGLAVVILNKSVPHCSNIPPSCDYIDVDLASAGVAKRTKTSVPSTVPQSAAYMCLSVYVCVIIMIHIYRYSIIYYYKPTNRKCILTITIADP